MRKGIGLLLLVLLIGTGFWAWSGLREINKTETVAPAGTETVAPAGTEDDTTAYSLTRRSNENNVTADVVFLNPLGQAEEGKLLFQVTLNTHSESLTGYDIANSAVVKSSDGKIETGFIWEPESEQDHHRSGLLTVPNNGVFDSDTQWLALELRDLAGTPLREFRWTEADLR